MKRSQASMFALCDIAFATAAQAQNRIDGIIGVNRTNISFEFIDFSPRTTFAIGVSCTIVWAKDWHCSSNRCICKRAANPA